MRNTGGGGIAAEEVTSGSTLARRDIDLMAEALATPAAQDTSPLR